MEEGGRGVRERGNQAGRQKDEELKRNERMLEEGERLRKGGGETVRKKGEK